MLRFVDATTPWLSLIIFAKALRAIRLLQRTCYISMCMIQETEVMRVLPRENEEINSEWIHDKARFSYDGLKRQRLDRPYAMLMGEDGGASLAPVTWKQGFEAVAGLLDRSVLGA